jgi:hypothetical protein
MLNPGFGGSGIGWPLQGNTKSLDSERKEIKGNVEILDLVVLLDHFRYKSQDSRKREN